MLYKRMSLRLPFQDYCILSNGFGSIYCKIVDVSKIGAGVLVSEIIPFEIGDKMSAEIGILHYSSEALVQWTKKDDNIKATRLGLKFSTSLL